MEPRAKAPAPAINERRFSQSAFGVTSDHFRSLLYRPGIVSSVPVADKMTARAALGNRPHAFVIRGVRAEILADAITKP